ncbi:ribonuclease H-like YkuK family protein [Brevibacillus dissolubilis]|uniref:ribonuclease H-like YkuK family protein n=1 Tax=Brevibacillus dissolubilis TaxID=1844116 RepID=UPI0011170D49|nr:ribonuclease H-like YkuK family protein [Brevibacillus dissolubilis]
MKKKNHLTLIHHGEFQNTTNRRMTLEDVYARMLHFMQQDPRAAYELCIGTDSQVHRWYTTFITGLVLRRMGKGAWACYRKVVVPRRFDSIAEKLSTETAYSEEIAMHFVDIRLHEMEDIVLPYVYQGASLEAFVHIDAGDDIVRNKTAPYVMEMVRRVESMGMTAKIKPESTIASSYANKFTKKRESKYGY